MIYEWTRDYPTVPGWYWINGGPDFDEHIQYFKQSTIDKQEVWSERKDDWVRVDEFQTFEFAGPIFEPIYMD